MSFQGADKKARAVLKPIGGLGYSGSVGRPLYGALSRSNILAEWLKDILRDTGLEEKKKKKVQMFRPKYPAATTT